MILSHKRNPFCTHQPVLIEAVKRTKGPILEMGSGEGSTVLLHKLCGDSREIWTVDHDPSWLRKYSGQFPGANHVFHALTFAGMLHSTALRREWGIVFLDQGDWQSREDCLGVLKEYAEIVIVHDSDAYAGRFDPQFKHVKTYLPDEPWAAVSGPPTFVGSDKMEVDWPVDFSIDTLEV